MIELFSSASLLTEDKVGWTALHIAVSNNLPGSLRAVLGLRQRQAGREKMFNRLKSYSCPHLVLSSCQTIQVTIVL